MLLCHCLLQVFIPEWPVEEGWEARMCKHLKKVLNHFPASIKNEVILRNKELMQYLIKFV